MRRGCTFSTRRRCHHVRRVCSRARRPPSNPSHFCPESAASQVAALDSIHQEGIRETMRASQRIKTQLRGLERTACRSLKLEAASAPRFLCHQVDSLDDIHQLPHRTLLQILQVSLQITLHLSVQHEVLSVVRVVFEFGNVQKVGCVGDRSAQLSHARECR